MGGVFLFIKQKISPEEIKKLAETSLNTSFPQGKFSLQAVDYSFGSSFFLELKNVDWRLIQQVEKDSLFHLENLQIKIPYWTLLSSRGTVELIMKHPHISLFQIGEKNAWRVLLENHDPKEDHAEKEKEHSVSASVQAKMQALPTPISDFLKRAQLDITMEDVQIQSQQKNEKNRLYFSIISLKNIGLQNPTDIRAVLDLKNEQESKLNHHLVLNMTGSLNVQEIIEQKPAHLLFTLETKIMASPLFLSSLPSMNINGDLTYDLNKKHLLLMVQSTSESWSLLTFKMIVENKKKLHWELADFHLKIKPKKLFDHLREKPKMINITEETDWSIKGGLSQKDGPLIPNLSFRFAPLVQAYLEQTDEWIAPSLAGHWKNEELQFAGEGKGKKARIKMNGQAQLYVNQGKEKKLDFLAPLMIQLSIDQVRITRQMLQSFMNRPSAPKTGQEASTIVVSQPTTEESPHVSSNPSPQSSPPPLPPIQLGIKWSNIFIDKDFFSGDGIIKMGGQKVQSPGIQFQLGTGKGKIAFDQHKIGPTHQNIQFQFDLTQLSLSSLEAFYPPKIKQLTGTLDGHMKGKVQINAQRTTYQIQTDLKAKNGLLKIIDLKEILSSVLERIPLLKNQIEKKDIMPSNDFDLFSLQALMTDKNIQIDKGLFQGIKKSTEVDFTGNLSMQVQGESELKASYRDKGGKIAPLLKKYLGQEQIPLRLVGKGFQLSPDYDYTLNQVLKFALDKNKEKWKEKIKDKVSEKLKNELGGKAEGVIDQLKDKFLQGDEGKANKLKNALKGLFQ
jgi:hypothetical protein